MRNFRRCAAALLLVASSAAAEGVSQKAAAESLFQEGRKLMSKGRVEEACRKFEESQRMVPKLGTLLNLATCHEKEGRTATAWAEFTEAETRAAREGQRDREEYARKQIQALEAKLSKLVVKVPHATDDLRVLVGEEPLGRGAWGTAVPVDPGRVTVRAERAGGATWSRIVAIPEGPTTVRVSVARLETLPSADATDEPNAPRKARPVPIDRADADDGATQRTLGWIALGVGAVGLGVGSYYGLRTFRLRDDSNEHCDGELCSAEGVDLRERAHDSALISTVAFGVGVAAVGGGIVLFATVGSESSEIALSGRF